MPSNFQRKTWMRERYGFFDASVNGTNVGWRHIPNNILECIQVLSRCYTCSTCKIKDCFHTTAKCVFWILIRNAHFELEFEWRSGSSFEMCILNYALRCNLAYTRSKIPSFESSFELRISNYASRCDFGVHTVQNTVFRILIQIAHFELKFKIRTLPSCENSQSVHVPVPKIFFFICERDTVKKSIAPTFSEKCLLSNEKIHFKVKGLRGDFPNSSQNIVPLLNPANMCKCAVVFSKVLSDPFIFETLWSII